MQGEGRTRVMHLISGLERGGAERMLLWTARFFDRDSFDLLIVSLMSDGPLASAIRGEGVRLIEMDQRRGRISLGAILKLIRLARSFSPGIIQGHLFHSNILSRFLALMSRGCRSLSTRHNEKDSLFRRFIYRVTAPLSSGTVVFSESVRRHVSGDTPRGEIHVAPYGIDPGTPCRDRDSIRSELDVSSREFVWIGAGRLTRQKGFDILIQAFSRLCEGQGEPPLLLIVGDGIEREALEGQASGLAAGTRVRFLGERDDVPDLMAASDAFVLSSRWEGGPLVLLEAMAEELPVVATRVGDAPNLVLDGETGILVDPGDPVALSGAMRKVMDRATNARLWGLRGKERVASLFHYRLTQGSLESFYRDLSGIPGRS